MPDLDLLDNKLQTLRVKLAERKTMDSFRLIHGRGKTFSGWESINVDFFQPLLFVTLYEVVDDGWFNHLSALFSRYISQGLEALVIQHRYLPQSPSQVLVGNLPEEVFARRGDLKFKLRISSQQTSSQQNLGYFLDMEPGRQWLESHCAGKKVLNLFAFTCAFSVVALRADADQVVNVDMSSSVLNVGRENHYLNAISKESHQYLAENILKSWSRIKKQGPYDLVVIDPPSFQKGSFVAERDYPKIIKRLTELMPDGGYVLACLNAPELNEDFLKNIFSENLPDIKFIQRLMPSPDFPDVDANRQLKMLVYKMS